MIVRSASFIIGLSCAWLATGASAQDTLELSAGTSTARSEHVDGARSDEPAAEAARAGMFLPLTDAPRVDSARAFLLALGGYDGGKESEQLEARGEVTFYGPIALRIGLLHAKEPNELRPTIGARVQALAQAEHGLDMSIGLFYKPEGFTEGEGEIEAVLALGRRFGRFGVIGDLAYGQDPEARERDGEVRIAALYTVTSIVEVGVDSRLRVDLGTEEEKLEEEGGAEYDLLVGPFGSVALGSIALGAQAGVAVLGAEARTKAGVLALGTISGAM